jgi:hypothetical protein
MWKVSEGDSILEWRKGLKGLRFFDDPRAVRAIVGDGLKKGDGRACVDDGRWLHRTFMTRFSLRCMWGRRF